MSKHCEKPWNGEEVGLELKVVQVVGQHWVLEFDQNREQSQIFLNHVAIVSLEESFQENKENVCYSFRESFSDHCPYLSNTCGQSY